MAAGGVAGETTYPEPVLPAGSVRRLARRASRASTVVVTTALVVLSLGAAVGRWQVLPAHAVGDGVAVERGDLVFVVPVSSLALREGDAIYVQYERRPGAMRRVGRSVDSWERRFELGGESGPETQVAQLPPTVWRVSRTIPKAGVAFGLLVGPFQSAALVLGGIVLIARTEFRRSRARDEAAMMMAPITDAATAVR